MTAPCALLLALLLQTPPAAEKARNPVYEGWTGFHADDWVAYRTQEGAVELKEGLTYRLRELTPEQATLEVREAIADPLAAETKYRISQAIVTATVERDKSWILKATKVRQGEEEIVCGEKTVKCSWVEYKIAEGETRTVWSSDEVPGRVAKMVHRRAAGETYTQTAARWKRESVAEAAPEAKELNDAARRKLAAGADAAIDRKPLSEACLLLGKALDLQVFADKVVILGLDIRKVSVTLKKGESAEPALTAALKPLRLTWTVYQGALIVTAPNQKAAFERGATIGGPSDEEFRKNPGLGQAVELKAEMTYDVAFSLISAKIGLPIERQRMMTWSAKPLGWSARRTALGHLRLMARLSASQLVLEPQRLAFKEDPALMGRVIHAVSVVSTVENARTAAYTGNRTLYDALLVSLKKERDLARDAVETKIDRGGDDEKGLKILKDLLKALN